MAYQHIFIYTLIHTLAKTFANKESDKADLGKQSED
jgi:hypothetical protein